jgi:hypothetical protein
VGPLQLFIFGLFLAWFVASGKARALLLALQSTPASSGTAPQTGPNTPLGPVVGTPSIVQNPDGSYDVTIPDINHPTVLHFPHLGPLSPPTQPGGGSGGFS